MSTAIWMERIREVSPRFKARLAGGLYVFSVLTALFLELVLGGRLGYATNIIQMSGMAAVTLLSYSIFKAVKKSLSMLAASFNLVGLAFEAFRLNPHGVNIAIVFHGVFCILIGYLIFRSAFLPRILGVLMAFAGLSWLTFLLASLANYLSPYNLACGLIGEASVFLWLLVMGVNAQRWREQADPTSAFIRTWKLPSPADIGAHSGTGLKAKPHSTYRDRVTGNLEVSRNSYESGSDNLPVSPCPESCSCSKPRFTGTSVTWLAFQAFQRLGLLPGWMSTILVGESRTPPA